MIGGMNMNENNGIFIDLISAFINRHDPEVVEKPDWDEVYRMGRIHDVSGMVYLMANKLQEEYKPAPEIQSKMKKDFFSTVMRSDAQDKGMEEIISALNEGEIPHILLKGFVVKNYYPAREMRTMGDIDILIKPEDREKSHKLLKSLGCKSGNQYGDEWAYSNVNLKFEVHTSLVNEVTDISPYIKDYFSSVWDHAVIFSGSFTYELDREYHFLFLMVHMAKHFLATGCGIRMIMDIAVYIDYFKDNLNWEYIDKEIEKLNLVIFSKNVYILCSRWFGTNFHFQLPVMEDGFYSELSRYILSGGTFGFHERNLQARLLRIEYSQSNQPDKKSSKIFSIINACRKKLFMDYHTMSNIGEYSFIKDKPLLLPIGWIYRFLYCAVVKGGKSLRVLKGIAKGSEEAEKQYEIISGLGL